jgi:Leu/Phe-tRNA-protein transferase
MVPRRIPRKIFGPVQNEDGSWRIRMNYEMNEVIKECIVRFIKKTEL